MTDVSVYATADDLCAVEAPEADLKLSNGATIRLRGLTRAQLFFNGKGTEDPAVVEARNLQSCSVRPVLSITQAEQVLRALPAGDGHLISMKIRELSGLGEGADKSAVAEV